MPRRYFFTTIAHKPVEVGGRSFKFEVVGQAGGSYLGVLATDDESEASILGGGSHPLVEEISEFQYDAKKKCLSVTPNDSRVSTKPLRENPLNHVVAEVAGSTSPTFKPNGGPNSTETITSVSLLRTDRQPPRETILEAGGPRKRW